MQGNALNSRYLAAEFELGMCQVYAVLNMLLLLEKKKSLSGMLRRRDVLGFVILALQILYY